MWLAPTATRWAARRIPDRVPFAHSVGRTTRVQCPAHQVGDDLHDLEVDGGRDRGGQLQQTEALAAGDAERVVEPALAGAQRPRARPRQ